MSERKTLTTESEERLIESIADALSRVSREDVIERSIGYFRRADADYGERLAKAVHAMKRASQ